MINTPIIATVPELKGQDFTAYSKDMSIYLSAILKSLRQDLLLITTGETGTGIWQRSGTTISPSVTGDTIATSGAISGGSLVGTLTSSAQPNITSVGTLTGLTLGGNLILGANTLTTANTGLVANLNADLLDGYHASDFLVTGSYQPLDATLTALAALDATAGFVKQTGADVFTKDTNTYYKSGDSPSFTAVTATSYNIGANRLDSDEWAFLDGQNQSVFTTSSPYFSFLGVGAAPPSYVGLYLNKTFALSSSYGIYGGCVSTRNLGALSANAGLYFTADWSPTTYTTANVICTKLAGATVVTKAVMPNDSTKNMTITNMDGFAPTTLTLDNGTSATKGTLIATTLCNFRAVNASAANGAAITTFYGFYAPSLTAGGTNWGIGVNTQSYINANLRIGSAVAPTTTLDLTGAELISLTLGVTGLTTCTGGIYIPGIQDIAFGEASINIASLNADHLDITSSIIDFNPTAANTDLTFNFIGTTHSGILYWMEDEDYFKFDDDLWLGDAAGTGKIKGYNGIATEGYGVPAIVDSISLLNQTGDSNLGYAPFTNADVAGLYRVNYYFEITNNAGGGDATLHVKFTDDVGEVIISTTPMVGTLLDRRYGTFYVRLASGSISYEVWHETFLGNSRYALHITVERLN